MTAPIKTTTVFLRPFRLPGFDETLPPGEYEIEIRPPAPADRGETGRPASSVLIRLQSRASHPGLDRTLAVPLAELERAMARDRLTGRALTDDFLEEMLADPMIRLVMQADGVEEADLRDLYAPRSGRRGDGRKAPGPPGGTAPGDAGAAREGGCPGGGE